MEENHNEMAARFGRWDAASFDPDFDTLPLRDFIPLLRDVFKAALPTVVRLLTDLEEVRDNSHPDKGRVYGLEHCLQMATRARREHADEEIVVAALIHDIGRVLNDPHHGEIAAALARGRLSEATCQLLVDHSRFQQAAWEGRSYEVGLIRAITEDLPVDGWDR